MQIEELRKRHPCFIYESYLVEKQNNKLHIEFNFLLEPDIYFKPTLEVPCSDTVNISKLHNLVFHIGLIEMLSYWKAACSPFIIIKAGYIKEEQVGYWHKLLIKGMSEFYYKNQIDFTARDFVQIKVDHKSYHSEPLDTTESGDLIMSGGGKDSSVTLSLLSKQTNKQAVFLLNPTRCAIDSANIANYRTTFCVQRTLDKTLLKLNSIGYLNGHTPFSALLAFVGILTCAVNGYNNLIASNESSANECSLTYRGLPINHQYSKSLDFETNFRDYCHKYLSSQISYFSFLRPLSDLQISALLAKFTKYHISFRSCNVNQQKDSWCKQCAKCAFTYLTLFPFLSSNQLKKIFGDDLFLHSSIQTHIRALVGIEGNKPFECVGTKQESIDSIFLGLEKCKHNDDSAPAFLQELAAKLESNSLSSSLLSNFNNQHFLVPYYENILRSAMRGLQYNE